MLLKTCTGDDKRAIFIIVCVLKLDNYAKQIEKEEGIRENDTKTTIKGVTDNQVFHHRFSCACQVNLFILFANLSKFFYKAKFSYYYVVVCLNTISSLSYIKTHHLD